MDTTSMLTDLTKARQLLRAELTVDASYGGHRMCILADCAATLDFV
jgi:hypothetical protein